MQEQSKTPKAAKKTPKLSPVGNRQWRLEEDFHWQVGHKHSGLQVTIPAGFIFDGASAPWFAWLIIRPEDPRVLIAALVHDFLYSDKNFLKVVADAIFYEVLLAYEFPKWRAIVAYVAVRLANRWS